MIRFGATNFWCTGSALKAIILFGEGNLRVNFFVCDLNSQK
jgi:hypothetical protein